MTAIQKQKQIKKKNNKRQKQQTTCFLKDAASCVFHSLSVVFSKSLEQGNYQGNLKLARINTIYKGKGSKLNPDSYRPISIPVLSAVVRLFEKLSHQQLIFPYLKDLLSKTQSGFKPEHSTETSFLNTTDKWIINI